MKPEDDEHHGDDCPECGAEGALLYMGGNATGFGSVVDKSYICDECGEWIHEDDLE